MVQATKSIVMPEHVAKVSINFKIRIVSTKMKTPASLCMLQSDQSCITNFSGSNTVNTTREGSVFTSCAGYFDFLMYAVI